MHQVCNTLVLVYLQNWPLSSPQNAHHLKGKAPAERCLFPATSLFSPSPGLHICYVSTLPMGRPHSGSPGSYSAAQRGPGLVLANVLHTALLPPSCPPALLPLCNGGAHRGYGLPLFRQSPGCEHLHGVDFLVIINSNKLYIPVSTNIHI